jgi:hypothetical protein
MVILVGSLGWVFDVIVRIMQAARKALAVSQHRPSLIT